MNHSLHAKLRTREKRRTFPDDEMLSYEFSHVIMSLVSGRSQLRCKIVLFVGYKHKLHQSACAGKLAIFLQSRRWSIEVFVRFRGITVSENLSDGIAERPDSQQQISKQAAQECHHVETRGCDTSVGRALALRFIPREERPQLHFFRDRFLLFFPPLFFFSIKFHVRCFTLGPLRVPLYLTSTLSIPRHCTSNELFQWGCGRKKVFEDLPDI